MTDNDTPKTAATEQVSSKRAAKAVLKKPMKDPRLGQVRSGLALILASLALIASAYLWYTVLYENRELLERDVIGSLDEIESDSAQTQETLANTEQQLKALKETQDTLKTALEKITNDLSRNRSEWMLAETEQLLIIASHRLQLARDARSALSALRAADQQLNQLANPNLLAIRKELAREIALLESLDKTDVSGITLRLAILAESVDRLPLAPEMQARAVADTHASKAAADPNVNQKSWRYAARNLWQDLLGLVRLRDNIDTQKPLLPPEQQYFLRENLRLMLYGSQQALLQGNLAIYQQNLKSAMHLVKEYFDRDSRVVVALQEETEKLYEVKIAADLPDISGSLTALRRVTGKRSSP